MLNDKKTITKPLNLWVAFGLCLGMSLWTNAAPAEVEANKATVARLIGVMGIPSEFPAVGAEVFAEGDVQLRNEFENLKYNAEDPAISAVMLPTHEAIANRTNTITRILGEGDMVAATIRIQGTHVGNLYGIPATGKSIDIESGAIFRLENGKITEAWYMADEAALLRQLGARLPARQDGKLNLAPVYDDVRTYDEALAEHLANPIDTPEFQHTRLLLSYKSQPENRPADYTFTGRPYSTAVRGGIQNTVQRGAELEVEGSHGASMSGRRDMVGTVISDGDLAMMSFRLTGVNSGPLYGIPASGNDLHDWELGFAKFEGDQWVEAWWMADELGVLLVNGSPEALDFLVSDQGGTH